MVCLTHKITDRLGATGTTISTFFCGAQPCECAANEHKSTRTIRTRADFIYISSTIILLGFHRAFPPLVEEARSDRLLVDFDPSGRDHLSQLRDVLGDELAELVRQTRN